MQCWNCDHQAQGVCRFCGLAVCKDHLSKMPFILAIYVGERQTPKAVTVDDALHCGVCKPRPEPIEMPEIF